MAESIKLQIDLPVSPERVYRAWLDGYEHGRITGGRASVEARVGGRFTARDGYVSGETLVMSPYSRIVQTWRTRDFPPGSPASRVELRLEPTCLGALLVLEHTGLPDGQARKTMDSWMEHYFRPMRAYFEEQVGDGPVDIDG
jgi:uncharacterized protein YndB with AHSA1/START domain